MLDLIIRGGLVLDGSGNPWVKADVGIQGDKITAIGDLSAAASSGASETIDAAGRVVAPGFIDMHSHSDLAFLVSPVVAPKVRQGITTEVLGQDGIAAAPMAAEHVPAWRRHLSGLSGDPELAWEWRTFGEYLDALERGGVGHNVACYAPHGNIRLVVMGADDRPASPEDLAALAAEACRCFEDGAYAVSTGLIYPPCCFAETAELEALGRVIGEYSSFFVAHQRNEGFRILESMQEMLGVGEAAGCAVHFSHFKAAGQANWSKLPRMFELLDRARAGGLDVTFDQYPYTAGSTMLSSLLPPAAHAGGTDRLLERLADPAWREQMRRGMLKPQGGWESMSRNTSWDRVFISSVATQANADCVGKHIAAIADRRGRDPFTTVFDLLLEERNAVGMVSFSQSEDVVREIMCHPLQMFCTDGLLGGTPHPRVYGSFPRVLGRYVRCEKVLELSDAVRRMTSHPAQRLGLVRRGMLREGYFADVTVFDPTTVLDRATYEQPRRFPDGIEQVVVNGRPVVRDGTVTGEVPGRVLRRGRD